jgi:excisionase family DNA binding protein
MTIDTASSRGKSLDESSHVSEQTGDSPMNADRETSSNPTPITTPSSLLLVDAAGDLPTLALRPREASKALGIGARKLWELTRDKKIPHFRLGTAILYPVEALRNWLQSKVAETSNE